MINTTEDAAIFYKNLMRIPVGFKLIRDYDGGWYVADDMDNDALTPEQPTPEEAIALYLKTYER